MAISIHFEVYDRDVFSDVLLSRTHRSFDGTLAATQKGATYECRTLANPARMRLVKAAAANADDALGDVSARHLAATDASWGSPWSEVDRAERATDDLAALTGWADARTARRAVRVTDELARARRRKGVGVCERPRERDDARAPRRPRRARDGDRLQRDDVHDPSLRPKRGRHRREPAERLRSERLRRDGGDGSDQGDVRGGEPRGEDEQRRDGGIGPGNVPLADHPSIVGLCAAKHCAVLATH